MKIASKLGLTFWILTAVIAPIAASGFPVLVGIPDARPEHLSIPVPFEDGPFVIELERHSLRGDDFSVRAWSEAGTHSIAAVAPPATYRGTLAGRPGTRVVAHRTRSGIDARIVLEDGTVWSLEPPDRAGEEHLLRTSPAAGSDHVACGLGDSVPGAPSTVEAFEASAIVGQHRTEIAFDVDFQYYVAKGGSIQSSVDAVEAILNQVDFFYARDLLVTYQLTDVLVRTAQYYFPTGGGSLLDLFRIEWNTNQTAIQRDTAHMMTAKSGIEFGGLAYVGAICNSFAYGWSLDSANIVGHELGHNWGSGHCHDLSPCNNMCGGCFFIGPATKDIMSAYRDSVAACLEDAGPYPAPLAPYAHLDRLRLTRDELIGLGPIAFDVLGNDHDGNLDPLSIDAHDAASGFGGAVALSSGTGPDGRDELVWSPPGFVFPGTDTFGHVVGDGTGEATPGETRIETIAPGLVGYWPFDEGSGSVAFDAANRARTVALEGGPFWSGGVYGSALRFDGNDDQGVIPRLDLRSDTVTLSAWVRRLGTQNPWSGIVFSREGNTIAGFSFGNAHELRYHWDGAADTWGWDSGLVVPDNTWTFVALVVEPDKATFFMDDGTGLQSSGQTVAHAPEQFDGATLLGFDSSDPSRRMRGLIDDVRVYDRALDVASIADLAQRGGRAYGPAPLDEGRFVEAIGELSWGAQPLADSHDVFFGDDYASVRDAGTGSPQFLGNRSQPSLPFHVDRSDPDALFYWRIDEIVGAERVGGDVWIVAPQTTGGHWRLDETSGTTLADDEGPNDGTPLNGVVLGEPGATAASGLAARFDGNDDHVSIPAIGLDADAITLSGWVRRDAPMSDWAGLVFSRAGSTVAGVSLRNTGELRYHWNDAGWDFSSGLIVPDDLWSFFALVVRPDSATLYLGIDGHLDYATNWTGHGVEAFDGPLDLGRDGTAARYFRGWLDDVRLFRFALSPREIERLYGRVTSPPSGSIPGNGDGAEAPLRLAKLAFEELHLTWSASCTASDTDYAVYRGTLGDFSSHVAVDCSTGGTQAFVEGPGTGNGYFLIVPRNVDVEGGYGTASDGSPRAPAMLPCAPQLPADCP